MILYVGELKKIVVEMCVIKVKLFRLISTYIFFGMANEHRKNSILNRFESEQEKKIRSK